MRILGTMVALIAFCIPLHGNSQTEDEAPLTSKDFALAYAWNLDLRGETVASLLGQVQGKFLRLDVDGGGYSESDIEYMRLRSYAAGRAQLVSKWLRFDLNGDLEITTSEIEFFLYPSAIKPLRNGQNYFLPTDAQIQETLRKLIQKKAPKDLNDDGVVTIQEMIEIISKLHPKRRSDAKRSWSIKPITGLDANEDGVLTWEEVSEEMESVLQAADSDDNGIFDKAEAMAFRQLSSKARKRVGKLRPIPER